VNRATDGLGIPREMDSGARSVEGVEPAGVHADAGIGLFNTNAATGVPERSSFIIVEREIAMNRREVLAGVGASVAVLAGVGSVRAEDKVQDKLKEMKECCTECGTTCGKCLAECLKCYAHCAALVAGGNKAHAECMQACLDCSEFCKLCLTICGRGGPMMAICCEACAKSCEMCAKACEKFPDDKTCAACAKMCRECIKCCNSCCKK